MSRHLPDVNVLLALIWPRHQSHAAAHRWFSGLGHTGWATNALTELGVLRLLTNPAVSHGTVSASGAIEALTGTTQHSAHEFWPLDASMMASLRPIAARLQGHQQWTDAVLLAQAAARKGVLVTFDAGVKRLTQREMSNHVLVLKDL